jgi:hypothetical protein
MSNLLFAPPRHIDFKSCVPAYQVHRSSTLKRPKREPNTTFRLYLETRLPTTPIPFVQREFDVGQTGI